MIARIPSSHRSIRSIPVALSQTYMTALAVTLVAVMLPLQEDANVWTLTLLILTALVALPSGFVPSLTPQKHHATMRPLRHYGITSAIHEMKRYDRAVHAVIIGSLSFIVFNSYFFMRGLSALGSQEGSLAHNSATTLAYVSILVLCVTLVVRLRTKFHRPKASLFVLIGLVCLLIYLPIFRHVGFGPLAASDIAALITGTATYIAVLQLLYHGRKHTRKNLFKDHPVELLSRHTNKR